MKVVLSVIDWISEQTGKLAAWAFFLVGIFVTYEVVMRYVFTAPTVWVDEVSRITQIWAAYLAGAYVLKHREMIVIDVAFRNPHTLGRRLCETFSILVILMFCSVTVWYGWALWLKSTLAGHTTDTYLALPKALTQASIWVGFGLLLLQALVELWRLWTVGLPDAGGDREDGSAGVPGH